MSSQVGEPVQCFMGSVIPADRHEVGERLPSHRETPPLRAGPSPQGARSSLLPPTSFWAAREWRQRWGAGRCLCRPIFIRLKPEKNVLPPLSSLEHVLIYV